MSDLKSLDEDSLSGAKKTKIDKDYRTNKIFYCLIHDKNNRNLSSFSVIRIICVQMEDIKASSLSKKLFRPDMRIMTGGEMRAGPLVLVPSGCMMQEWSKTLLDNQNDRKDPLHHSNIFSLLRLKCLMNRFFSQAGVSIIYSKGRNLPIENSYF